MSFEIFMFITKSHAAVTITCFISYVFLLLLLSVSPVTDPSEEAGVKATSLFRNQLLRPVHNTPSPVPTSMKQMPQSAIKSGDSVTQVNILQSESRVCARSVFFVLEFKTDENSPACASRASEGDFKPVYVHPCTSFSFFFFSLWSS